MHTSATQLFIRIPRSPADADLPRQPADSFSIFFCLMFFKRDCMVVGHKYVIFCAFAAHVIDNGSTVIAGQVLSHTIFFPPVVIESRAHSICVLYPVLE